MVWIFLVLYVLFIVWKGFFFVEVVINIFECLRIKICLVLLIFRFFKKLLICDRLIFVNSIFCNFFWLL